MDYRSIGENIRKYRKTKKMTQETLAEHAGLSVNYIGSIERGEKLPSLETFIVILNQLGVTADCILQDVVQANYELKMSLLNEKLSVLSPDQRATVEDVVDVLVRRLKNGRREGGRSRSRPWGVAPIPT